MYTYQDFEQAKAENRLIDFLQKAIKEHQNSEEYKIAELANAYDRQLNPTVNAAAKKIYNMMGVEVPDTSASNIHISSNFFARLNRERCTYSLGNGITFDEDRNNGNTGIKDGLGPKFDTDLYNAAYMALIHGVSYCFWNVDRLHVFPVTQFKPLIDENDSSIKAGIRFWSIDWAHKPVHVVLYEVDGYTKYMTQRGSLGLNIELVEEKRAYKQTIAHTEAYGDEVIGEENYSSLPIVPLYGNRWHQSTLIGMRAAIDSYDLILSGFANDITDCSTVYWLIGNALGMTATGSGEDDDPDSIGKPSKALLRYMENVRKYHVAVADTDNSTIQPYTQDIPHDATSAFLASIEKQIYRDFGAFNPADVAASGTITATQILAAYQTQDEEADAFEYQVIECVQQILRLRGIEATPQFKRNRIANQTEQVNMILAEADHLDEATILDLLPNITPEMAEKILASKNSEEAARYQDQDEIEEMVRDIIRQMQGEFSRKREPEPPEEE